MRRREVIARIFTRLHQIFFAGFGRETFKRTWNFHVECMKNIAIVWVFQLRHIYLVVRSKFPSSNAIFERIFWFRDHESDRICGILNFYTCVIRVAEFFVFTAFRYRVLRFKWVRQCTTLRYNSPQSTRYKLAVLPYSLGKKMKLNLLNNDVILFDSNHLVVNDGLNAR